MGRLISLPATRRTAKSGRTLYYRFVPRPVHYVQFLCHTSIFIYWGAYWPEVRRHIPALLVQIAFAYALDMLVCWSRKNEWWLSFGLFPIVYSVYLAFYTWSGLGPKVYVGWSNFTELLGDR